VASAKKEGKPALDQTVPTEIRLTETGRRLDLVYPGGEAFSLPAEYLRVLTPSAEARGHHGQGGHTVAGKKDVRITGVEPVGNYALRLVYDDGHNTGLYTWSYLRELGATLGAKWQAYLDELAAQGLSR
jgi:DUF971 family protein